MKKFCYSLFGGLCTLGIPIILMQSTHGGNVPHLLSPELELLFAGLLFTVGCICGYVEYGRKERKKREEELRKAEQDKTNEYLRQFLEKKLDEENNNKVSIN